MPICYHYAVIMNNAIALLFKPLTGKWCAVSLKYIASINKEMFHEKFHKRGQCVGHPNSFLYIVAVITWTLFDALSVAVL